VRIFESPSPLITVPEQAFAQTGAVSIERTLNDYPQFVPTSGATSNEPSMDGQANVSLRGLGVNRTLVLLDGRRLMPADGYGSVDLNILSPSLIRSVQVLTGGASTVYGSDALAGVVNIQLREDFDGLEFDGSASTTGHGDGEQYSAGLTAGTSFAAGRGSIAGNVGYATRSEVAQSDREFSRYPLQYLADVSDGRGPGGSFLALGGIDGDGLHVVFSDPTVFSNLFQSYGLPPDFGYQVVLGVNSDGTVFTNGNNTPGSVANYRGERDPVLFNDHARFTADNAPTIALQMPLERASGFLRGTFEVTESLELYAQALYSSYHVERHLAPADIGITLIPATNPFMPPDLAKLLASRGQDAAAPYPYFRRASEVGPRSARNERDVLQVTAWGAGAIRPRVDVRCLRAVRSERQDRTTGGQRQPVEGPGLDVRARRRRVDLRGRLQPVPGRIPVQRMRSLHRCRWIQFDEAAAIAR
jgi:outer membrane receptor protein involved in Fe transport